MIPPAPGIVFRIGKRARHVNIKPFDDAGAPELEMVLVCVTSDTTGTMGVHSSHLPGWQYNTVMRVPERALAGKPGCRIQLRRHSS